MEYAHGFEDAFEYMLENEGGFANDKDDKGGATKYGVSLVLMKQMFNQGSIWLDLHKDGKIDEKDVMRLSLDDAKKIYYEEFWLKGLDKLYEIGKKYEYEWMIIKLFDVSVNIGVSKAVMLFQRALNTREKELGNHEKIIKEDGIIGPKTSNAFYATCIYSIYNFIDIFEKFIKHLVTYYVEIVIKNPSQLKFLMGWINRAFKMPCPIFNLEYED